MNILKNKTRTLRSFFIYADVVLIAFIILFSSFSLYKAHQIILRNQIKDNRKIMDKVSFILSNQIEIYRQYLNTENINNDYSSKYFSITNDYFKVVYISDLSFNTIQFLHPHNTFNHMIISNELKKFNNFKRIEDVYIIPHKSIIDNKPSLSLLINNYKNYLIAEIDLNALNEMIRNAIIDDNSVIYCINSQTKDVLFKTDDINYIFNDSHINNKSLHLNEGSYFYSLYSIEIFNLTIAVLSKSLLYSQYSILILNNVITLLVLIIMSIIFRSVLFSKFNHSPMEILIKAIESKRVEKISLKSNFYEWNVIENIYNKFIENSKDFTNTLMKEITEKEEARESLAIIKEYLDSILNSLPSAIISIDNKRKITSFNHSAKLLFQIPDTINANSKFETVIPYLKKYLALILDSIENKKKLTLDKETFVLEDELLYKEITVIPLTTANNKGGVIIIDDITKKVKFQEAILNTDKMLNIGGLIAGIAHQINNPLSTIITGSQNIQRRLSNNLSKNTEVADQYSINLEHLNKYLIERDVFKILGNINDAANMSSGLIKRLMELTKKESSNKSTIQLNELLDSSILLVSNDDKFRKKYTIDIIKKYPAEPIEITTTVNELQQVIYNLFKNALEAIAIKKFPDTIKPFVKLSYRKEKNYIAIQIEDNGIGMKQENIKRIFDPLYTTKNDKTMLGLGIPVSYYIITEKNNGVLEIKSTENIGTEVTIKLPG